jgi:ligand-binding SRPBCC domain-containing protein
MIYRHRFLVNAPLSRVNEFHQRAASMAAITPPPIIVRVQSAPALLGEGDRMAFTLWLGPLPVRWLAQIESVSPEGFTDRQLQGPFAEWVHRHNFRAVDERTTEVIDEITLRLRPHLFWGPFGFGMRLGLPFLFAFRAWKTRRILK